ncbi:ABC-type branched-chain amino acid transport system, substrate-binding protein [Streptomyces sp. WMMB 714]|uniref:ABC transporter substrate-binding protein n=1 Tax=Streptomyces sp. WMMB 714 TaxID=1286822 RepID=UPI0006975D0F|nr:ABC transporter substrate-binding protein [Streptomyces sp. WMMB 714]SCK05301.1 ABC-type branched-chain amino acid transport system, substrate-binding protein [Streptomyces sp. WMMB 714]
MRLEIHHREWGPVTGALAAVTAGAVIVAVALLVTWLWPDECQDGLEAVDGECVGVTDRAFEVEDPETGKLLREIEKQNDRVRAEYESPSRSPYVRVALKMPFTYDDTSAMTRDMIRRAVAGALAAQREVNEKAAPHLQLLLAPDGKDLDKWPTVHEQLSVLAGEKQNPLVGVAGIPSSTSETREAIDDLSEREIPTVGPTTTSADMNSRYFFKTSPNNEEFAEALKQYLERDAHGAEERRPERGFLLYDRQGTDVYSKNLRKVIGEEFGKTWGLKDSRAPYLGVTGNKKGIPQRFTDAVDKICKGPDYDTIFFAGRDQDLPAFVEKLADEPCGDGRELRILKVGIGLDPTLTSRDTRLDLLDAHARLVNASSVDTSWWRGGEAPSGVTRFLREFRGLEDTYELGSRSLDDGYSAMYYDSVQILADAVDYSFDDINKGHEGSPKVPDKDVVYDTLLDPSIDEDRCDECLRGAGGRYGFGFERSGQNEQWAVCKPVPVLEFGSGTGPDPKSVDPLYRTYRGTDPDVCPSD